ncbi:MAG TPA: alcohol dehydrogenase catalytic domain-containing protein [Acidimicrobiia bacterium]|nr:alcohol dehydrogenase catalytic domain-containing protein [Acidimicrobiia bacterium]
MRAVRNTDAGIRVVDVPAPDHDGTRVRVRAAGICGSDLEMVRTGLAAGTLGHEIAGVLDDGTEVAVHPFVPCGACTQCRAGRFQLCREATASMLGVFTDGGMADEIVVPASCAVPLPAGISASDASIVEPLAVALHACNRAGISPGMRVGVVGAGTIGLLSGAVARHLGADVTILARHDAQRTAAVALGVGPDKPRDCDVVFEAAGTSSGFDDAVRACRRSGTLALVSTTWEPIPISFLNAQMREVTIVPAFVYGEAHGHREFDTAASIAGAHPEIASAVITHRFGLDEASHAFAVASDRAQGAIKVVLHP